MKRSYFTTININKTYIIFLCGLFLAKAMIALPSLGELFEKGKEALCKAAKIGDNNSLGGIGVYNDSDYKIKVTLFYGMYGDVVCPWEKEISVELESSGKGWLSAHYGAIEGLTGAVRFNKIQIYLYDNDKKEWEKTPAMSESFTNKKTGGSIFKGNYCLTLFLGAKNVYNYSIHDIAPGKDCPFEGARGDIIQNDK